MVLQINISIVISIVISQSGSELWLSAVNFWLLQKTGSPGIWVLTCPFDICDDLLYSWTDTSNFIILFLWLNIITIKMDNCNNLVITIVFAYFKAAIYANDPVPSGGQQDYGTSLLSCMAFYVLLWTCNSLRFHPWLKVSLVMTRP